MHLNKGFTFIQDGEPSYFAITIQNYLKEKFNRPFVKNTD